MFSLIIITNVSFCIIKISTSYYQMSKYLSCCKNVFNKHVSLHRDHTIEQL